MKVSLRHEESVAILEVSGAVDPRSFEVLKAGITKLFKDGKNRIVLSLVDATEIPGDVMRELAIIDVYARELSGKILLASNNQELKESVKLFAKPPVIPILSTVALALDYFKKAQPAVEDEEEAGALKAQLDAKTKEVTALEARIKQLDPKVVQELRALNADLKMKVGLLEKQVDELAREKREPADAEGLLEKVASLEDTVKRLAGKEA